MLIHKSKFKKPTSENFKIDIEPYFLKYDKDICVFFVFKKPYFINANKKDAIYFNLEIVITKITNERDSQILYSKEYCYANFIISEDIQQIYTNIVHKAFFEFRKIYLKFMNLGDWCADSQFLSFYVICDKLCAPFLKFNSLQVNKKLKFLKTIEKSRELSHKRNKRKSKGKFIEFNEQMLLQSIASSICERKYIHLIIDAISDGDLKPINLADISKYQNSLTGVYEPYCECNEDSIIMLCPNHPLSIYVNCSDINIRKLFRLEKAE